MLINILSHKRILITSLFFLFAMIYFLDNTSSKDISNEGEVSEVSAEDLEQVSSLTELTVSFEQFSDFFETIANKKGGAYAFELMRVADLPFGLDMHLLGHVVGDILYSQEGIDGMSLCTHDFRNACSHTMVIGALIDFGTAAFEDIREACYAAPGGKGAYTMCFHGLGHGVLAFNEYDMAKTIDMCDQLGTSEYNQREAVECFGGAVMEIIGGGGHDRESWDSKRKEYLLPEDPLFLCRQSYVTDKYSSMCYNYITPYMYEALEADMARPSDEVFDQVFDWCAEIPTEEIANRQACYGGQGKEFIGIATGRDFSGHSAPTVEALQQMYDWCSLANEEDGFEYCLFSTVDSLYWGGENDFSGPVQFCKLVDNVEVKERCFDSLDNNVLYYIDDRLYFQKYCVALPTEFQASCKTKLGI